MQYISLILLLIGIILITISYVKEKSNNINREIEYRYISKSLYDEQLGEIDLNKSYNELFFKSNPGKYGLDTKIISSDKLKNNYVNEIKKQEQCAYYDIERIPQQNRTEGNDMNTSYKLDEKCINIDCDKLKDIDSELKYNSMSECLIDNDI
tara:strand:- start:1074 stop:1529 length:456 start_codon:yes stop_codon:yes gene_type:complete